MGIFTKELLEKPFNLMEAVIENDEADLIFGDSNELLEEIAHIKGRNRMQIIIRNFMEDITDSHWFSMKFIPSRKIEGDIHGGNKGIPIVFEKVSNKIEYYPSNWEVFLGSDPNHIANAKRLMNELNKKEKAFIDTVVKEFGLLILEYWELDINDPIQYKRLREIQKEVESKLIKWG